MLRYLLLIMCFAAVCRPMPVAAKAPQRSEPKIEAPRFQGGSMAAFNRWVLKNMEFPANLYEEGDQAKVAVSFTVTRKGEVKNAVLKSTSDEGYSDQILRLLPTAPAWAPGMQDGKSVDLPCAIELDLVLRKDADGRLFAEDNSLYNRAETMPRFEDGGPKKFVEWVKTQVGEPLDAAGKPVDARVLVRFVIEKDGSVSDVKASCNKDKALAEKVAQAIAAAPRWTPASEQGESVRIKASMPVDFGKSVDTSDEEMPLMMVETMPRFQGGDLMRFREWVNRNLKYPDSALQQRIEGRVVLSFVIEKDGAVSNPQVIESPSGLLSEAAVQVVSSSPNWTPGVQAGRIVRVKYTLPVDFRLTDGPVGTPPSASRTGRN